MEELLTAFLNTLVENGILTEEGIQEVYEGLLQSEYIESFFEPESGLLLSGIFNEIAYITDSLGILTPLFVSQDRLFETNHLAEIEEKLLIDDTIEIMFDPNEPSVLTINHTDSIKINYNIDLSEGVGISFAINAINKILDRERFQYEIGEISDNGANFLAYVVLPANDTARIKNVLSEFFAEGELTDYQGLIESDLAPSIVM